MPRPNILLILTDQHRGDGLGIAGHPVLRTPQLDFLARSGTRFRRAYSETPICVPGRTAIMSGQGPSVHGLLCNDHLPWDLPPTLPGVLRDAGYQTEMIGKLGIGRRRQRFGFDHLTLANSLRGADNDYLDWLRARGGDAAAVEDFAMAHGGSTNGFVGRPLHLDETLTHSFWCVSEAITFLRRRDQSAPFFLNLSFAAPHPPQAPPAFCFDRYDRIDLPEPVVGDWAPHVPGPRHGDDPEEVDADALIHLDEAEMHAWRAAYYGEISAVDYQIGRLLVHLRRGGVLDNTFVLFTSDHGEMLGDHHMIGKCRAFEGCAHVPFLCRPPRAWGYPSGGTIDLPVGLQDVMPSLLDAAGVPIPDSVTGRSVLPLMRGETPAGGWRDVLHGECGRRYAHFGAHHTLTDGQTKYMWFSQTGEELLFDLVEDPLEQRNLVPHDPTAVGAWRERLIRELRDRPEGFTDGHQLIADRPHGRVVPGGPHRDPRA